MSICLNLRERYRSAWFSPSCETFTKVEPQCVKVIDMSAIRTGYKFFKLLKLAFGSRHGATLSSSVRVTTESNGKTSPILLSLSKLPGLLTEPAAAEPEPANKVAEPADRGARHFLKVRPLLNEAHNRGDL